MPRAICEDCGSLVEAELTHNGICAVGHYVHCGWGHQLSPDDLISDDVAKIISKLEAKLAKAVGLLGKSLVKEKRDLSSTLYEEISDFIEEIAEIKGESHD